MKKNHFWLFFLLGYLLVFSCSTFQILPRKQLQGKKLSSLVLTGYGDTAYEQDTVESYLSELKDLNSNTASFLYTCYVATKADASIDCQSYDSPKLSRISRAIMLAKQQDFIVSLRVYIDIRDQTWRCLWDPQGKTAVFKNLKTVLNKMAEFSEEHQVELLIIGAEYCQLTLPKYTEHWKKIISELRQRYFGKLTYGADWGGAGRSREWESIKFWSELDYIGIDHYQPLPGNIQGKNIVSYQENTFEKYSQIAKRYQKEIYLTELGFPGSENGHLKPFEWRLAGKSDEGRQASNFSYTLQGVQNSSLIKGVFIWRKEASIRTEMESYKPRATGYELYHRKAWYEIQDFFSRY